MSDGYDPIANPGSLRDLGGSAMVTGGGTETEPHGRASPAVKYIALIQDGRDDLRPLESHFGFWVVSTEESAPFHVEGREARGNVLARISFLTRTTIGEPTGPGQCRPAIVRAPACPRSGSLRCSARPAPWHGGLLARAGA